MEENSKVQVFEKELGLIKNPEVRKFTEEALKVLPEYFWKVPASSSGKYHSQFDSGEGGLIRHTRSTIAMAKQMFRNHNVFPVSEKEQDYVISALILHDGCKNGLGPDTSNTISAHPSCIVNFLSNKHPEIVALLNQEQANSILGAILSHMGQWNTDRDTNEVILPEPVSNLEKLVALCDFVVSRRFVEINLEAVEY